MTTTTRPSRAAASARSEPARAIPHESGTSTGTSTLDPVIAKLRALGLEYPALALPELVEQAAREDLGPLAFLDLLLTGQLERKDERRVTTMLKLSGLPPGKTLADFDWGFQPKADRRQIEALSTCQYLREKTNVLFLGPPGVGKSHLSTALGVQAIKNGFSVAHFVLDDLMHVLKADATTPPARLRARRYINRLLHHVAVVHIDGQSFRLRELGALLSPTREPPRTADGRST